MTFVRIQAQTLRSKYVGTVWNQTLRFSPIRSNVYSNDKQRSWPYRLLLVAVRLYGTSDYIICA